MFSGGTERNQGQEMDLNSHLVNFPYDSFFSVFIRKSTGNRVFGEILIRFQKNLELLTEDLKVH